MEEEAGQVSGGGGAIKAITCRVVSPVYRRD